MRLLTDGRYLCVEVTNLGAAATFWGTIQPGRGTASAAVARTALWNHSNEPECRLSTGEAASFRIAQRDRPPAEWEDDDSTRVHPEGPQAWRMCFLRRGVGASLERVCPVVRRYGTSADGVVLTVMSDPPLDHRTLVRSVSFDRDLATDNDSGDSFRILDSPRHYHAKITPPPQG